MLEIAICDDELFYREKLGKLLKRYLQKHVETLAARLVLGGNVGAGDTIWLDVEGEGLVARNGN